MSEQRKEPTPEGVKRYEPNGYYDEADSGHEFPCTCLPTCSRTCKGECGCEACHCAYADYLSVDYD